MPNTDVEKKNQCNREYYHRNKERILAKLRETSAETYATNKESLLIRSKVWRSNNYEKHLWMSAHNRARRDSLEFTIQPSDITIPTHCPYLGVELTRIQGSGRVWTNASIDRKDNSRGYTPDNVEVISIKANLMKCHASRAELVAFATSVLNNEQLLEILG